MTNNLLTQKILSLADDSFLLGHRNSEWAGHAPILEEDIAFANLALDELGHAQLWYVYYQELTGAEIDRVIFFRDVREWRNTQLVELPKGDWAFSMTRQYLFDVYENVLLEKLVNRRGNGSSLPRASSPIAEIAEKIRPEEIYHLRHTSNWVKRLGLGTDESHARMQNALNELWSYALQLFVPLENENELMKENSLPDLNLLRAEWESITRTHLTAAGLQIPNLQNSFPSSRAHHTQHLAQVLDDLQSVAQSESFGVEW